jgi:tripartite-type tricarboxylate transporter receptor subunit TctC
MTSIEKYIKLTLMVLFLWTLLGGTAPAEEGYYSGKTLRIIVTASAGGGTDTASRLLARFLPKYLPGNPQALVQNMPGGGGLLSNNYFYNRAKSDGTDLLGSSSSGISNYNRGGPRVKFNPREFKYIGATNRGGSIMMIRKDAKARLTDHNAKPVIGGDTDGTRSWVSMLVWGKDAFNWNYRHIVGYLGTSEMMLALRQGELEMWSTANPWIIKDLLKDGLVELIAQAGSKRRKDFPNLPTFFELLGDKRPTGISLQAYKAWAQPAEIDKPLAAHQDTPDHILQMLRTAYSKMVLDKDYIKNADKFFGSGWAALDGKSTQRMVLEVTGLTQEVKDHTTMLRKRHGLPSGSR